MPEKTDKMEQILNIDPPVELVFRGPYSEVNKTTLKLSNPTEQRILFKVKTTAPKSYCVRPNSGIIQGGEAQEVDVMLQSGDLPEQDRSKHKFMVQTMIAPNTDDTFPDTLWKETPRDQLMDTRLKCVFIDEQESSQSQSPKVAMAASDSSQAVSLSPITEDIGSDEGYSVTSERQVRKQQSAETPAATPSPSREPGQQEATTRMYEDKLIKLTSENNTLKSELNQIRHRNVGSAASRPAPTPVVTSQGPSLLPIIIFLILALILGYIVGKFA